MAASYRRRRRSSLSVRAAEHGELAVVEGVDPAARVERDRGVGSAERLVEEGLGLEHAALADLVDVAVLGVGVHVAARVDRRGVDAPLEAVLVGLAVGGGIGALKGPVGLPRAGLGGGVLERPLDLEVLGQLGEQERAFAQIMIVLD